MCSPGDPTGGGEPPYVIEEEVFQRGEHEHDIYDPEWCDVCDRIQAENEKERNR